VSGYQRLLDLALLETELALDPSRWDELAQLNAERRSVIASLPERAPEEALPTLAETAQIVADNQARLAEALRGVRAELAHLGTGRRALTAYDSTSGAD
jgi:hypothetical protein